MNDFEETRKQEINALTLEQTKERLTGEIDNLIGSESGYYSASPSDFRRAHFVIETLENHLKVLGMSKADVKTLVASFAKKADETWNRLVVCDLCGAPIKAWEARGRHAETCPKSTKK